MQRRRWSRGLTAAVILGATTLLLSGCSAKDWERDLRFGMPTGVTDEATSTRVLYTWSGVTALVLGIIVWALIFWSCIVYRKRKSNAEVIPRQTKYNLLIESICVVVPLLVVVGLFWRTLVVQNRITALDPHPDVTVRVVAFQWNWQFQYVSTKQNGKAVTTAYGSQKDVTPGSTGVPLYLNTIGTSDEIPVLVVPKGETVQVIEHSNDVVHSFWVPEFLFKRDVIPYGTQAEQNASRLEDNRFQFHATTLGSYVGRCSELCGTYHSEMNFEVRVVTPQVFQRYLAALRKLGPYDPARQHEALAMAKVPGGPYATTTHPFPTERTANSAVAGG